MDTQEVVLEIAAGKGLRMPNVHLDVLGLDAMVRVDVALLATPEESNKESRAQRLSMYLSTRFNIYQPHGQQAFSHLCRK